MMDANSFRAAVEVLRGGRVESIHCAAAVAVDGRGLILGSMGDPELPVYWRSAAKPFQALPLVDSGGARSFDLSEKELALACASHSGEERHVALATAMLERDGISVEDLQCGAHRPWTRSASRALTAAGRQPTALHNNCSGKHAAMLMLALHLNGSKQEYLHPESPGQQAILASLADVSGLQAADVGLAVDGCSAPTFRAPLVNLAAAYATLAGALANPQANPALGRIARAMTAHPGIVAGEGRLDTRIMESNPGRLIAKVGAEGIYGVAAITKRGPLGLALKIADGDSDRARNALAVDLLYSLEALDAEQHGALLSCFPREIYNRSGLEVGQLRVNLGGCWSGEAK
jgi:L-asparaginase II